MECELLKNLERIHTTEQGKERIRKNLLLEDTDVIEWCRRLIKSEDVLITGEGKNWYVEAQGCTLTINSFNYSVITAHKGSRRKVAGKVKSTRKCV